MTAQLRTQHLVLLFDVSVPIAAAPIPDSLDRLPDLLARGLAFDDPKSPPGPRPVVGKSDKVEGVGSLPARLRTRRPAEVEEAALLWMELKTVFPEALR